MRRSTEWFSDLVIRSTDTGPHNLVIVLFSFSLRQQQDSRQIRQTASAVVEEAFRSFNSVKVLIAHCENTPLQVKACIKQSKYPVCFYNIL